MAEFGIGVWGGRKEEVVGVAILDWVWWLRLFLRWYRGELDSGVWTNSPR